MAIKIQAKKTEIPVEIGELKFAFDVSDESIQNFREEALRIQKEFHEIGPDVDDEKALEQAKNILKHGFDMMLGEGSFEKIYELSPSVMICAQYFAQIVQGIEVELQNMGFSESQQEIAQKYIRKKK